MRSSNRVTPMMKLNYCDYNGRTRTPCEMRSTSIDVTLFFLMLLSPTTAPAFCGDTYYRYSYYVVIIVRAHGFEDPRNNPICYDLEGEKMSPSKQQSLFLRVKSQELETVEVCLAHAEVLD